MHELRTGIAVFLVLNVLAGLVRVARGPTVADRILVAQLFGTTGVAVLLLLAADQPGRTLVLLSKRYGRALPARPGVTYLQPSAPIRIDKFDYANPEGLQEAYDLGFADGRRAAKTLAAAPVS